MKTTEFERRLAVLESRQSGKLESTITLTLPAKPYEPAYPATPVRRLFREVLDTTP